MPSINMRINIAINYNSRKVITEKMLVTDLTHMLACVIKESI